MKFVFRQTIDAPRDVVFAFFRNPRCLPLLHVKEQHIRVLRHGADVRIGAETWAEVTMFGILPVVLGFRHDIFEPPRRFGETLFHGLFTKFTHVHEFRECGDRTEVVDWIEVELPWLYGGEFGARWLVAPGMKRSFAVRHRELGSLVATGELRRRARENLALLEAA
jgi:ligand-binding SRPBCC domain-containing protein